MKEDKQPAEWLAAERAQKPDERAVSSHAPAATLDYPSIAPCWDQITSLADYLEATRSMPGPYTVPALGCDIIVLPPHVMSPAFDCASHFFAETLVARMQGGERVLDVGCGCGILSVIAARSGAAFVTALDINPHAVENTRLNFEQHAVAGTVIQGSAFDGLGESPDRFDIIVFHAPFCSGEPRDLLEVGAHDPGYRLLRTVILEGHRYLEKDGILMIAFSETDGDAGTFDEVIAASQFREIDRLKRHAYGERYLISVLRPEPL